MSPAEIADGLLWTAALMAIGAVLLGAVEWWMDRPVDQPTRAEHTDDGVDLHAADDFFRGNSDRRTRIALARTLPTEKSETRTVAAAGSRTIQRSDQ